MRILAAALASFCLSLGLLSAPSPAYAADGYVYVVVNDRVCGQKGVKVRAILANVRETGWTTGKKYDSGDNIVYPKVRLGKTNLFTAKVLCQKRQAGLFWVSVGYSQVSQKIAPTKNKQTIWVG